ncbi:MAG: hypothetical protein ABI779_06855 [Acidobacteriota bacterium]
MNTTKLEPLLIKAIDGVSKKAASAEKGIGKKATKIFSHWDKMDDAEKEQVIGIAVATLTTAVTAIVALRRRKKSPLSTAGKVVKAVKKKVF